MKIKKLLLLLVFSHFLFGFSFKLERNYGVLKVFIYTINYSNRVTSIDSIKFTSYSQEFTLKNVAFEDYILLENLVEGKCLIEVFQSGFINAKRANVKIIPNKTKKIFIELHQVDYKSPPGGLHAEEIPYRDSPRFDGGPKRLNCYLNDNIDLNKVFFKGIPKKVRVVFLVKENGILENISIEDGYNNEIDKELVRLFKNMPPWKPAISNGTPYSKETSVEIEIPYRFLNCN